MVYSKIARQCFWSIVKDVKSQSLDISGKEGPISCRWPEVYGKWLIQHQQRRGRGVPVAAVPLPQADHALQDEEEWETEDEEETVGVHEETEPEEQNADSDLVNLAQVQVNLGDETDDNQVLPLD